MFQYNIGDYSVSYTNYVMGPPDPDLGEPIGSHTDTGNWWNWFLGLNTSAYAVAGDSHATPAGNQKATGEFVPVLNIYFHLWQGK